MKWTIPNILTTLRLLAAPMVAVMFLYFSRPLADWLGLILFAGASITDWFDGYLARLWKQESKLGTMLDPIADKAMVLIALTVIIGYSEASWTPLIVLPATVIVFREVFVSGLREFLGDTAGTLKVTGLAKWKTTAQMIAIAVLFSKGIFEHHERFVGMAWAGRAGVTLLWLAAFLTLATGMDYFRKAIPYLKEDR
jgi:CDP-diacylglycerol--glycerol-3-phosphate 3-phosphatidyltransferase